MPEPQEATSPAAPGDASAAEPPGRWRFWIDRGGTFTDAVAHRPGGEIVTGKVLSEHPAQAEDAAVRVMRELMDCDAEAPLPAHRIAEVKMGTTVATNALLERTGAPTALVVTEGFRDALVIGDGRRPELFARRIERPDPLYEHVIETSARVDAQGSELTSLDREQVRADLEAARAAGCRACAVALMHGYRHPAHEQVAAAIARDVGFEQVSASHEVSPLMKLIPRGRATVVDAYVSPVLDRYVARLTDALDASEVASDDNPQLLMMQSSGGLIEAERLRGRDALLSGPAGGVVGAAAVSEREGIDRVLSFDMGGTSTDVACYANDRSAGDGSSEQSNGGRAGDGFERTFELEVAGHTLHAPALQIHTVAAGGGSVCRYDRGRYRVGPASAGADPGPAAYGCGGPLTVTDCNVRTGRLQPDFFPEVFGPRGDAPLDPAAVQNKFDALTERIGNARGDEHDDQRAPEAVAEGFLDIAVQKMAQAIRRVTLERGRDPARYALCCFGGAGGQHACRVAETLGVGRVLVPPHAGVLSAYSMGAADVRATGERSVEVPLAGDLAEAERALNALVRDARAEVEGMTTAAEADELEIHRRAHLRYDGTDAPLPVPFGPAEVMRGAFEAEHRRRYGFRMSERALTVETVSAEVVRRLDAPDDPPAATPRSGPPQPTATADVFAGGAWRETPVYERSALQPGDELRGPALLPDATGTTVLEPGWQARVTDRRALLLSPTEAAPSKTKTAHTSPRRNVPPAKRSAPDPVRLELFNHRFRAVADEMGATLQNTSYSVNIKERRDFSCALFDAGGALVANAPHIPVHLGSMGASVRHVIADRGKNMRPGDAYVQNSPYHGGTHLPDLTVVAPVFDEEGNDVLFYLAARGHHADVGGTTPGSMPPQSTHIEEEGVLIEGMQLASEGRFCEEAFREALRRGPHPARNPDQNVADAQAQVAAVRRGEQALRRLIARHGRATVRAYAEHVQQNAADAVREVIGELDEGAFSCALDTGEDIRVAVTVDREQRRARIDFGGTSAQVEGNFNAPPAIGRAAVLYVFRTLVGEDLPLNDGCLRPLDLVLPKGSLLNPHPPAAVVAGNVETSQLIVDALYGALGAQAASQGTMNNVTFGTDRYQYYETLGGGSGAGPGFDGAAAVQCHMTNSSLTDPEVLEWRFPVLLEHFGRRPGSGGAGQYRGGDGAVRRVRFRAAMTASVLSGRRAVAPFGLKGGADGAPGRNRLERRDGTVDVLGPTATLDVEAGDVLVVETPGGGGYGSPDEG
jgi:5-oxoprolinase (ATP-hydrolysing)